LIEKIYGGKIFAKQPTPVDRPWIRRWSTEHECWWILEGDERETIKTRSTAEHACAIFVSVQFVAVDVYQPRKSEQHF